MIWIVKFISGKDAFKIKNGRVSKASVAHLFAIFVDDDIFAILRSASEESVATHINGADVIEVFDFCAVINVDILNQDVFIYLAVVYDYEIVVAVVFDGLFWLEFDNSVALTVY